MLPMTIRPDVTFAAFTDTGRLRDQNEDCVEVIPVLGLAMLADGMGGHQGGEVASNIAVQVVREVVSERSLHEAGQTGETRIDSPSELLAYAFRQANAAILDEVCRRPNLQGMGTTLIAALVEKMHVTIAHVGDSRAYLVRHDAIHRLTKDHTLLQQQVDVGLISKDDARNSALRNLLARAVGTTPPPETDIAQWPIETGDLYLLCSDGLTDMLTDQQIFDTIRSTRDLDAIGDALIDTANRHGGRDNISVLLMRIDDHDDIPVLSNVAE